MTTTKEINLKEINLKGLLLREITADVIKLYLSPLAAGGIGFTLTDLATPQGMQVINNSIEKAMQAVAQTGEPIDFNEPLPDTPNLISHN